MYPGALARTYYPDEYDFTMSSPDKVGVGTCAQKNGIVWEIIGHFGTLGSRPVVFVTAVRPLASTRAAWLPARQKKEEQMWQELVEIERGRVLRTDPHAASRLRRLKWRYHELANQEEFSERRDLHHEALDRWKAGQRLCAVCDETILPHQPFVDRYDTVDGVVTADVRHKGCGDGGYIYDDRKPCVVCGKRTTSSTCIWHLDGMYAELRLCNEHRDFEIAKRLVLEMKAGAVPGVPVWFESEESARARSLVESDDLIVVPVHGRFFFAFKKEPTDTWYDPVPGWNLDRDIPLLRVILTRLIDMMWYLKEEVMDLPDDEVPRQLRGGESARAVFYDDDRFRVELADADSGQDYYFYYKRGKKTYPADGDHQSLLRLSQRVARILQELLDQYLETTGENSVDLFSLG